MNWISKILDVLFVVFAVAGLVLAPLWVALLVVSLAFVGLARLAEVRGVE